MTGPLLYDVEDGGVAILTLHRPDKRNALDAKMISSFRGALSAAAEDTRVRALVVRGAGPDFCAGADLAELETSRDRGTEASLDEASALGRLFIEIRRHPRPVLAAVHGRALAGGCGLALACDLVLARDDAELGFPEVHLGFVPAMVMALLRRKVAEGSAFDLAVTGRRVDAREARRLGLVQDVLDSPSFDEVVLQRARELASLPAAAVKLTKRLLYGLDSVAFEDAVGRGAEVNALARTTEECREGVRRFLERVRGARDRSDGMPPSGPAAAAESDETG